MLVLPGQGAQNLDEKMEVKKRNKYGCEASQGTARDAGVLVTPTTRRAGLASFVASPIATNTQQAIASKHERPIASRRDLNKFDFSSHFIRRFRIIGLVVEYTPATGETRVRFPDDALQSRTFYLCRLFSACVMASRMPPGPSLGAFWRRPSSCPKVHPCESGSLSDASARVPPTR